MASLNSRVINTQANELFPKVKEEQRRKQKAETQGAPRERPKQKAETQGAPRERPRVDLIGC